MRYGVKFAVGLVIASVAGIVSAHMAMGTRVEPATSGDPSWQVWQSPEGGDDPYVIARFLLSGRLPPARGPALEFEASVDKEGQPFASGCIYRFSLKGEDWRWWSIEVPGGGTVTSTTSIADPDGTVRISLAAMPQPGNWLTTPYGSGFRVFMHVLPTADAATPPPAVKQACT